MSGQPLPSGAEPSLIISCESAVLAAATCAELGVIAAATANGAVEIYSTIDGAALGVWRPLAFNGSRF